LEQPSGAVVSLAKRLINMMNRESIAEAPVEINGLSRDSHSWRHFWNFFIYLGPWQYNPPNFGGVFITVSPN
jgi:hypothetical protein